MVAEAIKPGYKQTEVGVIPEDWEVKRLDEIFSITAGGDLKKELFSKNKDEKHPFPIYSNSLLSKGLYGYSSEYEYDANCVTITARGTLGVAYPRDHKFNAIIRVLVLSPIKKLSCNFISEYINSKISFSIESTGVPQLTAPQISKYKIAYSNPEEQSAIATVLSDADALIESLNKLITKKKNIKQGAMQELLTGKKRLPGFSGEWQKKPFGELVNIRKQKVDPGKTGPYSFCVELEHISQGSGQLLANTETTANSSIKVVFKKNDILFGKLRAYLRKYWFANRDGVASTEIWPFIAIDDYVLAEYIFQLIQTDGFIEAASTAYGTHMPRTDWNVVKNYNILFPQSKEEQSAIAQVLSDMDAEIEGLGQERDKYLKLKVGMMQQLLTGKIRLKC